MNAANFDLKALLKMAHSPVKNYAVPGLTSSLIGKPSEEGCIRLFHCEREHQEPITPHSHRFDFQCWVLKGTVRNRLWKKNSFLEYPQGDLFQQSTLIYNGQLGSYKSRDEDVGNWSFTDNVYSSGECYSMKADEVHSIYFSRGALVLFFEGKTERGNSVILEPYVDNQVVRTFKVEPWMFRRAA